MAASVSRFNRGNYELEANTEQEEKRYKQLRFTLGDKQANIKRDLAACGHALRELRDQRLYKAHYPTFDQFCRIELGLSKTHANRLIAASDVSPLLDTKGVKVAHEGILREYVPLAVTAKQPQRAKVVYETVLASRANATAVEHHKAVKAVSHLSKSATDAQVKKAAVDAVTPTTAKKPNGTHKPPTLAQRNEVDEIVHAINRIASSTNVVLDEFLGTLSPAQRASFVQATQSAATYLASVVRMCR